VKAGPKATSLDQSPLNRKLLGERDIFNTEEQPAGFQPGGFLPDPTKKEAPFVPDACLLRFLDVTARPGQTYQYRLQVKLANPNYKKPELVAFPFLATQEEITGPWVVVPQTATIPGDSYYYAVNEKLAPPQSAYYDRAYIQMHQYMDVVRLDPNNRASSVPIGDWVIGDVPVYRGEIMARLVDDVDVLMYYPTRETYDVVRTPPRTAFERSRNITHGISVDFLTNDVLVDFEGGEKQTYKAVVDGRTRSYSDDGSVEMLILSADGKLQVRVSGQDRADKEREQRLDDLQARITGAKTRPTTGTGGIFGPSR
jgi:hypothetical protein